jgi:hypothetical protein
MKGSDLSDEALMAILRGHPDLRNSVASIALAVENADGAAGRRGAAFGPGGAPGMGGEAGGDDRTGNPSAASDASPG